MRSGSTTRPAAIRSSASSALPAASTSSGTVTSSACQPPSARSCSPTELESRVVSSPGARAAAVRAWRQATGLRLWGIALEPPTPFTGADSSISPTSACESSATSRAILPTVVVTSASSVRSRVSSSRWSCHARASCRCRRIARPLRTIARLAPIASRVPTAPPSWMQSARSRASARRRRQRWSAAAHRAIFSPAVIGVAGCIKVRPSITAPAWRRAWPASRPADAARTPSASVRHGFRHRTSAVSRTSWLVEP